MPVLSLSVASALFTGQRSKDTLRPTITNNTSISSTLYDSLAELAQLTDVAYCVSTAGIQEPFECLSWCTNFPHFELVETFNTGSLLGDAAGYVALDHSKHDPRIIVAFRGTYNVANTITDLSTMPQKYVPYIPPNDTSSDPSELYPVAQDECANCTVHAGFLTSWFNSRDTILSHVKSAKAAYPKYQVHLVGHSLGGAVSLLAALDFQSHGWDPIITTFGEPRVGNAAFVDYVNGMSWDYRRVTHIEDPVPLLPPMNIGYRSHGSEIYIASKELPTEVKDVVSCDGNKDPACSASGDLTKLWQLFFAHRDYFVRMGLCMRKDRSPWEGWLGDGSTGAGDEL